jgi:hypothetical protein
MNSIEIGSCQSGFHSPQLELKKLQLSIEPHLTVILCDFCFCRMMDAIRNNVDLTMDVLYLWAQQCGDILPLPNSLQNNGLQQAKLVKFVNDTLDKVRDKEKQQYKLKQPVFPVVILDPESKNEFIRTFEEDENTIQRILNDVPGEKKRKNIIIRLWTGGLEAGKILRTTHSSSELNPDGSPKQIHYDSKKRNEYSTSIEYKASKDPIYRAGVEAASIHELKMTCNKEIYLDGIPETSTIWKYVKDNSKGKAVITLDDITPEAIEEKQGR